MILEKEVLRRVEAQITERFAVEPVIALHGPRGVGKSTTLRRFAKAVGGFLLDFDDPLVREATEGNLGAATSVGAPLCVDEYQRLPEVLDAIKARLNREGSLPGTAVITGSTRHDALPRTAQALTGRIHTMSIWPLSQGELSGVRESFVENAPAAIEQMAAQPQLSQTTRAEYVRMVVSGGMPLALRRPERERGRWFDDYVRISLERDVMELSKIRDRHALRELFTLLSAQTAQLLNVTSLSESLQISRPTVDNYLRLMEDLYLTARLPAWGRTLKSRVTEAPKIHIVDSGVAARTARVSASKLTSLDPVALTQFGHLLETFVVGEVRKQASWMDYQPNLGHWRTRDGAEVDLIVEYDDGSVIGIEVKANERAGASDFKGLTELRDLLGKRFKGGVILTTGARSYRYSEKLYVMPIDRLWSPSE